MNILVCKRQPLAALVAGSLLMSMAVAGDEMTAKSLMTEVIVPSTTVIWGAYDLKTEAQWEEVKQAALDMANIGRELALLDPSETNDDSSQWQVFTQQMSAATEKVLAAVDAKDEEALFNAGNDELYPPCEACHQLYQNQ